MLPTLLFIFIAYLLSDLYTVWSRRQARLMSVRHRGRNFKGLLIMAGALAGLIFFASWLQSGRSEKHLHLSEILAGQNGGWTSAHVSPEFESLPVKTSTGVEQPVYAFLSSELNVANIMSPPKRRLSFRPHKRRLKKMAAARRKRLAGARNGKKDKARVKNAAKKKDLRLFALCGN